MPRTAPPSTDRRAVFVVGRTGTGKTTLSKYLDGAGLARISASECLRQVFVSELGGRATKAELADYGQTLRDTGQLPRFHDLLIEEMMTKRRCSVDGLRFYESYLALSADLEKARLIFLECPDEVRLTRLRLIEREHGSVPLDHPTEISIDDMQKHADLVLDTSRPASATIDRTKAALREWHML